MTRKDYDAFCKSLPHATHVVQWGDASVWKIGGKVFAIGGWSSSETFAVTFKCSKTSFEILKELPGACPAPYLASRGLSWIQRIDAGARANGLTYNRFIQGLKIAGVEVDRKILADLAVNDLSSFVALVEVAKAALPEDVNAPVPA